MKRVILATVGTVAALVALLSFKSHPAVPGSGTALPSAILSTTPGAPSRSGAQTTTSAPPAPNTTSTAPTTNRTSTKTSTSASASASASARSTVGSAVSTRYGVVQVKVVTVGHRITAVSFAQLTSHDGRSAQINSQAGPLLLSETLSAQSAHVDAVSGATYTSDGYRTSLQSALDQVGIR